MKARVARVFQDVSEADHAEHSQQAEDYQQAAGHGGHQHGDDQRQHGEGADERARIGESLMGPHVNEPDEYPYGEGQDEHEQDGAAVRGAREVGAAKTGDEVIHNFKASSSSGRGCLPC